MEIQYLRSHATQDILEAMNDTEIHEMAKLGKQKKSYDDSIRDLDDVYFEVQQREEQRRKQGLPSLIGVLRGYQPPTSEQEQTDVDLSLAPASRVVQSRHSRGSASETLQQNESMPKTGMRRRSRRAS